MNCVIIYYTAFDSPLMRRPVIPWWSVNFLCQSCEALKSVFMFMFAANSMTFLWYKVLVMGMWAKHLTRTPLFQLLLIWKTSHLIKCSFRRIWTNVSKIIFYLVFLEIVLRLEYGYQYIERVLWFSCWFVSTIYRESCLPLAHILKLKTNEKDML